MLEMARAGAKVLQPRSVELAKKYNVPVCVKSSFTDEGGTLVTKEGKDMEKEVVSGVTYDRDQAKITVVGAGKVEVDDNVAKVSIIGVGMISHSGVAAKMFQALAKEGINIMMISTSEIKVSCVVESKYTELAVTVLHNAFELEKAS